MKIFIDISGIRCTTQNNIKRQVFYTDNSDTILYIGKIIDSIMFPIGGMIAYKLDD